MNPLEQGYKMVSERHAQFVSDHPQNIVETTVVHFIFDPSTKSGFVTTQTRVWKDKEDAAGPPDATDIASMPIPGATNFTRGSEAENCSTSSLGRALALLGYHPKESMASSDEIAAKATDELKTEGITAKQRGMIMALAKEAGMDPNTPEGKVQLQAVTLAATGKHSSKQLTNADVDLLVAALKGDAE